MLDPFAICIISISILAALGLPIGHAMIVSSILYLLLAGLDLGTAAEQLLNGLFNSYVLLAVPLFILAADLMNQVHVVLGLFHSLLAASFIVDDPFGEADSAGYGQAGILNPPA